MIGRHVWTSHPLFNTSMMLRATEEIWNLFYRRTKSAGHTFMFSALQWPATFTSSFRGLQLIPILLNLLLINNVCFPPLPLSFSLSLCFWLPVSNCAAAAAMIVGVLRNLHSVLYCLRGERGGAVVGFLLICGFEPWVAPVPWCRSQYWIWPRSHLRAVG